VCWHRLQPRQFVLALSWPSCSAQGPGWWLIVHQSSAASRHQNTQTCLVPRLYAGSSQLSSILLHACSSMRLHACSSMRPQQSHGIRQCSQQPRSGCRQDILSFQQGIWTFTAVTEWMLVQNYTLTSPAMPSLPMLTFPMTTAIYFTRRHLTVVSCAAAACDIGYYDASSSGGTGSYDPTATPAAAGCTRCPTGATTTSTATTAVTGCGKSAMLPTYAVHLLHTSRASSVQTAGSS
jgi:hypothetical protein